MNIKFFKAYITGKEIQYMKDLIDNGYDLSGDGKYTKKVHAFLQKRYNVPKVLLTTSCTTALEMAVRLLDLKPGDEIIAPSFTFSSTINAILMAGGIKVVFADVTEDTLNIDPDDIERKITQKTKAIIVVHYAGIACDMDRIMAIAKKNNLRVIEDAAQAIESTYKGKYLGTIGDLGCLSFHDTKNITSGEGGALLINNVETGMDEVAEIMREKGTNRSKFFRGEIDKYTWVNIGSSYLPSDLLAAFLYAQLEHIEMITLKRKNIYNKYYSELEPLVQEGLIKLPKIPVGTTNNAHIFYMLLSCPFERDFLLSYLKQHHINATFHYVPLHSSPQGIKMGNKAGDLPVTESISDRLIRLPLYAAMTDKEVQYITSTCIKGLRELQIIKKQQNSVKRLSVTVGIPAYNEESNIENLIHSIYNQYAGIYNLEKVTVICDGSSDKTPEIIAKLYNKYPSLELINHSDRKGKAQRLNELYQKNTSDVLVTFDADIGFKDRFIIEKMVRPFYAPETGLVAAYDKAVAPVGFQQTLINKWYDIWGEIREYYNGGDNVYNIHGNANALRREFAKQVQYPVGLTADQDYIYLKSQELKYKFVYAHDAVVYFNTPDSIKDFYFQSNRFLTEKEVLKTYFAAQLFETYEIPRSYKLAKILYMLNQDPIITSLAGIMYLRLMLIRKQLDPLNIKGMWQPVKSTKKLIVSQ